MKHILSLFFLCVYLSLSAHEATEVFCLLKTDIHDKDSLLSYFRNRKRIELPGFSVEDKNTEEEQKWAEEALVHRFFVHSGYQPSFFYGDDIDWQYWPVKDNELRWQLHRTKWWIPLGRAYRNSGDEKYAKEWVYEYIDWIKKNPLGDDYNESNAGDPQTADNMYFAWRPLEVSDRIEAQIIQFRLFLPSVHFTGDFLASFLTNYHRHCEHIMANFSSKGNHLLFEAQRLLYGAIFFPEFKDAERWKNKAVEILNSEIKKQVYSDGMQYELDPHYHLESINIFFKALCICDANGQRGAFHSDYIDMCRKMIEVIYNYSYPDYHNPMFSDFHGQRDMIPFYTMWSEVFPEDEMMKWLATKGHEGKAPDYTSRAFDVAGYYCMRNGWDSSATVMVMKAGPKGEWHCQPDNGTFEYWRKGRNFFPDSGCYVYGGDAEILQMREWFRQTAIHNTLTLDGKNLETTDSHLVLWEDTPSKTVCVVENQSYKDLKHIRKVIFFKNGRVIIKDFAIGKAAGKVSIRYSLPPCEPIAVFKKNTVATNFDDGNNIVLKVKASKCGMLMERQEGRISYEYRHYESRPAYSYTVDKKAGENVSFTTIITPASE